MAVDFAGFGPCRIGPVGQPALGDAFHDPVEFILAYQESVVLGRDGTIPFRKIERDAIGGLHDIETGEFPWLRQSE